MPDTIAAVATGAQVAAIGILRLSGPKSHEIVNTLFRPASGKKMLDYEDRRLVYGGLYDADGSLLDLCMCTVSHAPRTYTGEDTAELQCHGSPILLQTALAECFRLGARQARAGEFTKRAFLNGRMDLSAAEAVADLIDAESAESAKNAAGQLSGAITRKTEAVYELLTDISAHYHAVLDYPDEDIEDFRLESYKADLRRAEHSLDTLLGSFERGRLMTAGIPAAIVGRPNAGKSSLLNALLGYERAIVTDVPGTTRDTIEEKLRLGSLLLRLTDTAGIRDTADTVERLGVERSRLAMERAELVIDVLDGSAALSDEDLALLREAEKRPRAVLVVSKSDLGTVAELPETSLPVVVLSARTGEGLDDLRAALSAMEEGRTPDIVLTESEAAMAALGELSGRSVREDVTDRIFRRFCVGK